MKHFYLLTALMLMASVLKAQVTLEADIRVGNDNSTPTSLTVYNGELLFRANDGTTGSELFKFTLTDGAELVDDINSGGNGSPNNLVVFDDKLFFTGNGDNRTGIDLFSYDGTSVELVELYQDQFSALFNPLIAYNKIYYVGFDSNFTANRLIEFDGTSGGEVSGSGEEAVLGGNFIDYNGGLLLYMRSDNVDVGTELFFYNIDTGTFSLVKDIVEGTGNSGISQFTKLDGEVYFEAESQVWKTNGTETGTVLVQTIADASVSNVREFIEWNGELYFEGDDGNGDQLWKYNPTTDIVTQLSNINGTNTNHDPSDYVVFDGFLYYAAEDANDTESHLWRTDGTSIEQLDDTFVSVSELAVFDNRLFFRAEDDGETGQELFSLDPATLSIQNVNPNAELSIYPNPTRDLVKFTKDINGSDFQIFNLNGQLLSEGKIENDAVDVSKFKGTILLNVNDGREQKSFKVISN
jgi:ELWxxDGT repeat protein